MPWASPLLRLSGLSVLCLTYLNGQGPRAWQLWHIARSCPQLRLLDASLHDNESFDSLEGLVTDIVCFPSLTRLWLSGTTSQLRVLLEHLQAPTAQYDLVLSNRLQPVTGFAALSTAIATWVISLQYLSRQNVF